MKRPASCCRATEVWQLLLIQRPLPKSRFWLCSSHGLQSSSGHILSFLELSAASFHEIIRHNAAPLRDRFVEQALRSFAANSVPKHRSVCLTVHYVWEVLLHTKKKPGFPPSHDHSLCMCRNVSLSSPASTSAKETVGWGWERTGNDPDTLRILYILMSCNTLELLTVCQKQDVFSDDICSLCVQTPLR